MILLKNAALITEKGTEIRDIVISDGEIRQIGEDIILPGAEITDCENKLLLPGFIDAHVHLREPGFEQKETIRTGTEAAAAGGFTTVMPMPNLRPVPDDAEKMKEYIKLLRKDEIVKTEPYASITRGEKGDEVVDMKALLAAGAAAFSDDGVGVQSPGIMREAMEKAADAGTIIVAHTEDNSLKNQGCVHQGSFSEKNGLRGIPSACEYKQVERDIELVRKTGARYHVCHVSTAETVSMVRKAKCDGLPVTCEVTPHHLTLTDEDVKDSNWKMNPPLRSRNDREALIEGIKDGTIEIIATDHAPHTVEEKSRSLDKAPFGIVGLETAFPVLYTALVKTGVISLRQLSVLMSENPARLFGFEKRGKITEGFSADLVLVDVDKEYVIEPLKFRSMGKNTPYGGEKVFGKIMLTMVNGRIVYDGR